MALIINVHTALRGSLSTSTQAPILSCSYLKKYKKRNQNKNKSQPTIDYCTKKETTLRVSHFTILYGHFSAKYINIVHKTGVQTNMGCLTCLNINWIKSYDLKHIFFFISLGFQFWKKKNENLLLIKSHFSTISGHFSASCIDIFHKTEFQTVILRCLVCLNLN